MLQMKGIMMNPYLPNELFLTTGKSTKIRMFLLTVCQQI